MIINPFPSYQERVRELQAQKAEPWQFVQMALMVAGHTLKQAFEIRGALPAEKKLLTKAAKMMLYIQNEIPNNSVSLLETYEELLADSQDNLSVQKCRELNDLQNKIIKWHREATLMLLEAEKQHLLALADSTNQDIRNAASEALYRMEDASKWLMQTPNQNVQRSML